VGSEVGSEGMATGIGTKSSGNGNSIFHERKKFPVALIRMTLNENEEELMLSFVHYQNACK